MKRDRENRRVDPKRSKARRAKDITRKAERDLKRGRRV